MYSDIEDITNPDKFGLIGGHLGFTCDKSLILLHLLYVFFKAIQMSFLTLKICPVGLTIQLILISLFFWRPSWIYLFLGYATLFYLIIF